MNNWRKLILVRDIQVFIGFANVIPWSCDSHVKVMWSQLYINGYVILILSHLLLSTKLLTSFIIKSNMSHFQLLTSFATVTINLSLPSSYRIKYNFPYINTSSFWSRSLIRLLKPLLDCWLVKKNYLQISAFLDLVVVKRKKVPHILQKKAIGKVTSKMMKSWLAGRS